jgi:hypothetical protein
MKKLALISFTFIFLFLFCGESNTPSIGSEVLLYDERVTIIIIADSKSSYDQLIRSLTANDKYARNQLLQSGKVYTVKKNTRALILDLDSFAWKVRILEGEHKNRVGWVMYEWARRINSE